LLKTTAKQAGRICRSTRWLRKVTATGAMRHLKTSNAYAGAALNDKIGATESCKYMK